MTKYKLIELTTYIMFLSGFLLWEDLNITWQAYKISQISHILFSLTIMSLLLIPFVISHTNKHKKTIVKTKKSYKKRRQTFLGIFIGFCLLILLCSGIYLLLFGNRGGDIYGIASNLLHFYLSFLFIFLIIYHSYYLGRSGNKEDKVKLKKLFNKEEKKTC